MRTLLRVAAAAAAVVALVAPLTIAAQSGRPPDWIRFRGPNGSGVSNATNVPIEFGPDKNVVWRVDVPLGYSSPILFGDRVYLTGVRDKSLLTLALDRATGKTIWEAPSPGEAKPPIDKRNNPASPSVAVEANGVYTFFPDYGLVAYTASGKELWRLPLGPFNNIYGMGASPVIVGDLLVLAIDQSRGSHLLAVDKRTGKERWKTPRPEATSGHATPIVWRAPNGRDQILLPGSFLLTAYDAVTGQKLWWVRGLSWEIKSTPVVANNVLYINGYGSPEGDQGRKIVLPPADEVFKTADADQNGTLSKAEFPKGPPPGWFNVADLDLDGAVSKPEWEYIRAALESENGMLAIRLGGSGDMTDKSIVWKYHRSVPQLPSPLLYNNVLYMVNDGGIVTSFNPETGEVIKQGRLTGALGNYFASPVAADGHVFFTSQPGVVAVLKPDGDLTPLVVNPLNEDVYATPAIADGRLYVRTTQALWAFGKK
jgi:outer membrane protein assembly factor BamB